MDIYSLTINIYYNPSRHEIAYDHNELHLRNLQINCITYFILAIIVIAFTFSGYFYARIILFLKFHEKNLFSSISNKNQNKIDPVPITATTNNQSVPIKLGRQARFAIVDENGEVINQTMDTVGSALPIIVAVKQSDEQKEFPKISEPVEPVVFEIPARSTESVVNVFVEEGDMVKVKKNEVVLVSTKPEEAVKVDGDVCLMSHGGNKNREKGKRRLEARTAKKTFMIMLSFLSCQFMSLCSIIVHKMPIFTENKQVIDGFDQKFFALSLLGIFFTILSFLSCFFNAFTFIVVTDYFKYECIRNIRHFKNILINKLKRKAKKATSPI